MERERRHRVTVDMPWPLYRAFKEGAQRRGVNLKKFLVEAIRARVAPEFQFFTPPTQEEPLKELFLGAHKSLVMIGTTLSVLQVDSFSQLLAQRIEDGISMTFVMFDPQITEQDPAYRIWQASYEGWMEGDLTANLQRTFKVLEGLNTLGKSWGSPIKAFGIKDFPACSLVITDPISGREKMMVGIYTHGGQPSPFILIDGEGPQAAQARKSFLQFYVNLLSAPPRPILT